MLVVLLGFVVIGEAMAQQNAGTPASTSKKTDAVPDSARSRISSDIGRISEIGNASDAFGTIGLLTMPSARGAEQGTVEFGLVGRAPYRRSYLRLHPFDWLEVVYRYDDITSLTPDGEVFPATQSRFWRHLLGGTGHPSRKDRSFDIKVRLWDEGDIRPAFAFGLQDMFGRAAFGGEYFVLSKRFGDFDFTAGLGFGYLGSRRHFGNPFRGISGRFRQRELDPSPGGFNFGSYFQGNDVALFGGVEWASPIAGLTLLAEYSGADPQREPFGLGAEMDERVPLNVGLRYRPSRWFDFALGLEGGRYLSARASLRFNVLHLPRFFEDPPLDPYPKAGTVPRDENAQEEALSAPSDLLGEHRGANVSHSLNAFLIDRSLDPSLMRVDAMEASLMLTEDAPWPAERWPELAEALFARLPPSIDRLSLRRLDQPLSRAQIFLRRSQARSEAATILSLMANLEVPVRLCGRRLVVAVGNERERRLPDAALASLGQGIGEVVFVSGRQAGLVQACQQARTGRRPIALDKERARFRARAVLDMLSDPSVEGVTVRGTGLMGVLVASTSGSAAGQRLLARLRERPELLARLNVAGVATLPVGKVREEEAQRADRIMRSLKEMGIEPLGVSFAGNRASVWIGAGLADRPARTLGRALRMLDRDAPPRAVWLEVAGTLGGGEIWRVEVLRRDVQAALAARGSPEEVGLHASWLPPRGGLLAKEAMPEPDYQPQGRAIPGRLQVGVAPVLIAGVGRAEDGLIHADVDVDLIARLRLAKGLVVQGAARRYILGNLDSLDPRPDRQLPAVRSDIARYSREGHNAIADLTVRWDHALGRGLYMRLSAGLFEPMFGGFGGELVYHPRWSRWTLDGELYWVKQRGFSQGLGFRDYSTVTGHLGVIYDAGSGLTVTGRAGRYLAGDWGASLEVAQRFANGIELGGWLTASSRADLEFGRAGNLDKGLFVRMPIDIFWAWGGPRHRVEGRLRSLVRDSGQRLQINERLYERLLAQDPSRILGDWTDLFY